MRNIYSRYIYLLSRTTILPCFLFSNPFYIWHVFCSRSLKSSRQFSHVTLLLILLIYLDLLYFGSAQWVLLFTFLMNKSHVTLFNFFSFGFVSIPCSAILSQQHHVVGANVSMNWCLWIRGVREAQNWNIFVWIS